MTSKIHIEFVNGLDDALGDKADVSALAGKADAAAMTTALADKADAAATTAALATKASAAFTWAASQVSTSGTAFDFTGIPATANEIIVFLDEVFRHRPGFLIPHRDQCTVVRHD